MRDNNEGYPEIRDAYERDGHYFGVVRITLNNEAASFEFGVQYQGYVSLRRILQARPFDTTPGVAYRYFFSGRMSRSLESNEVIDIGIWIEQGTNGKVFDFPCPKPLVSNLIWFQSQTDFTAAAASLKRVPE